MAINTVETHSWVRAGVDDTRGVDRAVTAEAQGA